MMTPGGFHSEIEIPEEIEALRQKYPHVRFEYAWPFDKNLVADMLLQQVQLCRQNNAGQSTPTPTGNTS